MELYDSVFIPALRMAEQDRHKGAIDAVREEFLFLSINEMIAEFLEYSWRRAPRRELPAGSGRGTSKPRVLCLPAHDRADEITADVGSDPGAKGAGGPGLLQRRPAPNECLASMETARAM